MEPEAMTTPKNPDPWAVLSQAVEHATPDQCPRLMGCLEQLKASLWLRMTTQPSHPAPMQTDCLLTADEVAQRLNVTKEYVYKNASRYPFTVREGRYVRFSQNGLSRYIDRRQRK